MRSFKQVLAVVLAVLIGLSSPAFAQRQHAVNPSDVAAAVSQHVASETAARAAVRDALSRQDVRDTAASMGLDPVKVASAVDMLSGSELQRAASLSHQLDQPMVGGSSTIVISTTTIILVLLIVLLVVLVAK